MRFDVSHTDFKVLVGVLSLFEKGGYGTKISRVDLIRECGLDSSLFTKKIKNLHIKQQQLKETIQ